MVGKSIRHNWVNHLNDINNFSESTSEFGTAVKAQASLRFHAVTPEHLLLAPTVNGSKQLISENQQVWHIGIISDLLYVC